MKITKVKLKDFRRFTDLTIDLSGDSKKIVALVGPNGSGKSSIFDAFLEKSRDFDDMGGADQKYLSKLIYKLIPSSDYSRTNAIELFTDGTLNNKSFYVRSPYRHNGSFNVVSLEKLGEVTKDARPKYTAELDSRLQQNYKRLWGQMFDQFQNGSKPGTELRAELVDEINGMLSRILDIQISDLGNIIDGRGQLYFQKGDSKNFPFENLSSGEKEVVDILLDFIVKREYYQKTIFCIDEPELHLNTQIQRKLLIELERIIPESCQLWVATHSIGFLRALQDDLREKSTVIDFSSIDFDQVVTLQPIEFTRKNWQRIFRTALEDITGLLAPRKIVYCEGKINMSLDEKIFNTIFYQKMDALFVSSTNKADSIKYAGVALTILNKAFSDVEIIALVDRDDAPPTLPHLSKVKVVTLTRREFENYLCDFEIISKAYPSYSQADYSKLIVDVINDDIKTMMPQLATAVGATNVRALKETLAEQVVAGTTIYDELEKLIFS